MYDPGYYSSEWELYRENELALIESDYKNGYHTASSGIRFKLSEMSDGHLHSCMKYFGDDSLRYEYFQDELERRNLLDK